MSELEQHEDSTFQNLWVLIETAEQNEFLKPARPHLTALHPEFGESSTEEIQKFVEDKCGEHGIGRGDRPTDWLTNNCFAVVDKRTEVDRSVLFYARESATIIQEAEVRVAWGSSSDCDQALVYFMDPTLNFNEELEKLDRKFTDDKDRYKTNDPGYEDFRTQLEAWCEEEKGRQAVRWFELGCSDEQEQNQGDVSSTENMKGKLEEWIDEQEGKREEKWFEIRLYGESAIRCAYGIGHIGPYSVLTEHKDLDFDEHGVMRY